MPKKIGSTSRSTLVNAPLPPATKSYTVISHGYAINTILKAMEDNGFEVIGEEYRATHGAKVAHGALHVRYEGDEDLNLVYTFTNSYDKSLRFRAAIGARVSDNGAYMISEIDNWKRKHTGTADNETEELINQHIENAEDYFSKLKEDKECMKGITINKSQFGQIIGELFINGFLALDQLSTIQKEYENPSFNYSTAPDSLWTCYNHIIFSLRQSHPNKWMQNQLGVHLYFVSRFNLGKFDDETDGGPAVGDNMIIPVTDFPDIKVDDIIEVEDIRLLIKGETEEDGIDHWYGEIVEVATPAIETVNIQGEEVTALPGILDGVEEFDLLPGFEPNMSVEAVMVDYEKGTIEPLPDPNQKTLEEAIAEAEEAECTTEKVVDAIKGDDFKLSSDHLKEFMPEAEQFPVCPPPTEDCTAQEIAEALPEEIYFEKAQIDGVGIGDTFTMEQGVAYLITGEIVMDGKQQWVLTPTVIEEPEESPWEETENPQVCNGTTIPKDMVTEEGAGATLDALNATLPEPTILGAESPEEEAQVKEALQEAGLAPGITVQNDAQQKERIEEIQEMASKAPAIKSIDELNETLETLEEEDSTAEEPMVEEKSAPVVDEDTGEMYIPCSEYEGIQVGDAVEVDGGYFEVMQQVTLDEDEFFYCKPLIEEVSEDTEEVTSMGEEVSLPAAEEAAVAEPSIKPQQEDEIPTDLEEITVDDDILPEEGIVEVNDEAKPDPIEKAIAAQLEDVYGEPKKFVYTEVENQYNVVMDTGETITFPISYIEGLL